jgi:hypothetical protein
MATLPESGNGDILLGDVELQGEDAVFLKLEWTYRLTPELKKAWEDKGFVLQQCHEPGLGNATVDNYLAIWMFSPAISSFETAWSSRTTPALLDSWTKSGFFYVKCYEPGWGSHKETQDNYFALKVNAKPGKRATVSLKWFYKKDQMAELNECIRQNYACVNCEEPGLKGAEDNWLAIKVQAYSQ